MPGAVLLWTKENLFCDDPLVMTLRSHENDSCPYDYAIGYALRVLAMAFEWKLFSAFKIHGSFGAIRLHGHPQFV